MALTATPNPLELFHGFRGALTGGRCRLEIHESGCPPFLEIELHWESGPAKHKWAWAERIDWRQVIPRLEEGERIQEIGKEAAMRALADYRKFLVVCLSEGEPVFVPQYRFTPPPA